MYVQVNFGRNVGTVPMAPPLWDSFTSDVVRVIVHYAADMSGGEPVGYIADAELHDGFGTWDGVEEQSRHLSLFWEDNTPADQRIFSDDLLAGERLRKDLRELADAYGQDNVALIVGSELI